MNESQALAALRGLSNETRLQIVRLLVRAGPDGMAAGDLAAATDAAASRMSFHLSNLEHAGLLVSERQSRKVIYRVDFERMGGVINYLLVDCCRDHPDIRACCDPINSGRRC